MKKFRGYSMSVDTRLREQGFLRYYYQNDVNEYIYIAKTDDGYIVVDTDMRAIRFVTSLNEDEFVSKITSNKASTLHNKFSKEIELFEALGYEL